MAEDHCLGDIMSNKVFDIAFSNIDPYVGDILAKGIIKKAVTLVNATEDTVTPLEMRKALNGHIAKSLASFMAPNKAKDLIKKIEKEIQGDA